MKLSKLVPAILAVLIIGVTGCTSISPGSVGIKVSLTGSQRGVQDYTLVTGWVGYNPITTSVIEYPVYVQTKKWTKNPNEGSSHDDSITFTSSDSMIVNADVSVSYELDPAKVPEFYVHFRADDLSTFSDGYFRNVVRDAFNEQAGKYTVEQIMGDNAPLLHAVQKQVQDDLVLYGVKVDQLGFIGAPRPPGNVLNAINSKVQAEQIALQKQNEVAQATADAKKAVAEAQGRADANTLLTKSLTPELIRYLQIQKWNGQLPQVQGSGAGILFSPKQ